MRRMHGARGRTRRALVQHARLDGHRQAGADLEGVSPDGTHPVQMAWKELDAPQCGYCQSGMIMAALALLRDRPRPTDADIDAIITNACRCGTYHRVRQAIHLAAERMK
jgi:isoquinoline 1-oxidoreductase alpha subunit